MVSGALSCTVVSDALHAILERLEVWDTQTWKPEEILIGATGTFWCIKLRPIFIEHLDIKLYNI